VSQRSRQTGARKNANHGNGAARSNTAQFCKLQRPFNLASFISWVRMSLLVIGVAKHKRSETQL
jgi:hypothetical protein